MTVRYPPHPLSAEKQAAADAYRQAGNEQAAQYHEEDIEQLDLMSAKQTDNTDENVYANNTYQSAMVDLMQNKPRDELLQAQSLQVEQWPRSPLFATPGNRKTEWPDQVARTQMEKIMRRRLLRG